MPPPRAASQLAPAPVVKLAPIRNEQGQMWNEAEQGWDDGLGHVYRNGRWENKGGGAYMPPPVQPYEQENLTNIGGNLPIGTGRMDPQFASDQIRGAGGTVYEDLSYELPPPPSQLWNVPGGETPPADFSYDSPPPISLNTNASIVNGRFVKTDPGFGPDLFGNPIEGGPGYRLTELESGGEFHYPTLDTAGYHGYEQYNPSPLQSYLPEKWTAPLPPVLEETVEGLTSPVGLASFLVPGGALANVAGELGFNAANYGLEKLDVPAPIRYPLAFAGAVAAGGGVPKAPAAARAGARAGRAVGEATAAFPTTLARSVTPPPFAVRRATVGAVDPATGRPFTLAGETSETAIAGGAPHQMPDRPRPIGAGKLDPGEIVQLANGRQMEVAERAAASSKVVKLRDPVTGEEMIRSRQMLKRPVAIAEPTAAQKQTTGLAKIGATPEEAQKVFAPAPFEYDDVGRALTPQQEEIANGFSEAFEKTRALRPKDPTQEEFVTWANGVRAEADESFRTGLRERPGQGALGFGDEPLIGAGPAKGRLSEASLSSRTLGPTETRPRATFDPNRASLSFGDESLIAARQADRPLARTPEPSTRLPTRTKMAEHQPSHDPHRPDLSMREQPSQPRFGDGGPRPPGKFPSFLKPEPIRPNSLTPGRIAAKSRQVFGEILGLPRTFKSSWDQSYFLRQGLIGAMAYPTKGLPLYLKTQKVFWGRASEATYRKMEGALDARPNARVHREAGLSRTSVDNIDEVEEAFVSRLANRAPGVGRSQRAYTVYLNTLRADMFDAIWNSLDELDKTPANGRTIADMTNAATGRGKLVGLLKNAGGLLGTALFSPRNLISRPQFIYYAGKLALNPKAPGAMRVHAARQLAAYFVGTSTILWAGKEAGLWDVELDPRSADFGKARMGPLRYDPWTGYSQIARMMAQVITGERKSTYSGKVSSINRLQAAGNFGRSKLAPVPGEITSQLQGKDFLGDPIDNSPFAVFTRLFGPITAEDAYQSMDDYGWEMTTLTLPFNFLGISSQVYSPTEMDRLDKLAQEALGMDYFEARALAGDDPDFAKKFNKFSQRPDVDKLNAESLAGAADAGSEGAQRVVASNAAAERYRPGQVFDDDQLARKFIPPGEWRDNRKIRQAGLRGARDEIYASVEKQEDNTRLDRYYSAIDSATSPNGVDVDWDRVDAWLASQDQATQRLVNEKTGQGTDTELRYRADVKRIGDSGLFEVRDEAWRQMSEGDPELSQYKTLYDYKRAAIKELGDELVAGGYPEEGAYQEAEEQVNAEKFFRAAGEVTNALEMDWISANPKEAYLAWQWGLFNPTTDQEQLLLALYEEVHP